MCNVLRETRYETKGVAELISTLKTLFRGTEKGKQTEVLKRITRVLECFLRLYSVIPTLYLNSTSLARKEFDGDRYCAMECNKALFKGIVY